MGVYDMSVCSINASDYMLQRLSRDLQSLICKRDHWSLDSEHKTCQCCGKNFTLLRRRHHCRICGKIYCSSCCDYFLNGKYCHQTEYYVRYCEFCKEVVESVKRNATQPDLPLQQDSEDESQVMEHIPPPPSTTNHQITSAISNIYMEVQLKYSLSSIPNLLECLNRMLEEDISEVRIIDVMDQPMAAVIQGIVLEKNTACKRMMTHLTHAKVIIIEDSIDIHAFPNMSFADLITHSHTQMSKLLELIMKINPDVIFVGNSVNLEALQWLRDKKVAVFNKIEHKDLQDIASLVGVKKIIKNISQISKYKHSNIIGICNNIYIKEYQQSKSLLFIEKQGNYRSLLISQSTLEKQQNLLSGVSFLLKYCSRIQLQMELMTMQSQLFLQAVPLNPLFSSMKCFTQNDRLTYSRISYKQSPMSPPQLQYAVTATHIESICGDITSVNRKTGTTTSIKEFMEVKAAKKLLPCQRCSGIHSYTLYFPTHAVKYRLSPYYDHGDTTLHLECCEACFSLHRHPLNKNYAKNSFYYLLSMMVRQHTCTQGHPIKRVLLSDTVRIDIESFKYSTYALDYVDYRKKECKLTANAIRSKHLKEHTHSQGVNQMEIIRIVKEICRQVIDNMTLCITGDQEHELNRINDISDLINKIHYSIEQIRMNIEHIYSEQCTEFDWTTLTYKLASNTEVLCSILTILNSLKQSEPIAEFQIDQLRRTQMSEKTINSAEIEEETHSTRFTEIHIEIDESQETVIKTFVEKALTHRYPALEKSILSNPIAQAKDPVSVLGCALNSKDFLQFHRNRNEQECFRLRIKFTHKIQIQSEKGDTYEIAVHYHRQFEELRILQNIRFEEYVSSLCSCRQWVTSGGKTKSKFSKSHDQLLVVKLIKEKQFYQFHKFAKQYLKYMMVSRLQSKCSLLTKVFGCYEVTTQNKTKYCIVMQNVFFGIMNPQKTYDLKGSQVNRLSTDGPTGLDTNLKIDRQSRPFVLRNESYDELMLNLESDIGFLKNQAVIDYSLLLIQASDQVLRVSIIDFMRPYHLFEKIQNLIKEIRNDRLPTVIPPEADGSRFLAALKGYFMRL